MIQRILICDSRGYPFYSRKIDNNLPEIDKILLSGFISSIGTLGSELFNKKVASITFGEDFDKSHVYVVTREFLSEKKTIYFVFFMKGECNTKLAKEISTTIFIESKNELKKTDANIRIDKKIDTIIDNRFNGLKNL
ncbi:MAG: hypothetical protein ACTSU4_02490 [Promethearchaeota archaeon]